MYGERSLAAVVGGGDLLVKLITCGVAESMPGCLVAFSALYLCLWIKALYFAHVISQFSPPRQIISGRPTSRRVSSDNTNSTPGWLPASRLDTWQGHYPVPLPRQLVPRPCACAAMPATTRLPSLLRRTTSASSSLRVPWLLRCQKML